MADVRLGYATHAGPRPYNEDFVAAAAPEGAERAHKGVLLAIADGVGGHAHGREAAEYTVRSLLADYFSTPDTWSVEKSLAAVLAAANRWLLAQAARTAEYAGMATTLTALVLRGRRFHLAHVGDARAYLWRDRTLLRLTEDHTWPHPELSNVLRRAVGLERRLLVDFDDGELAAGDRFVLATDGVWNALGDDRVAAVLQRTADPQAAADTLVAEALRAGTTDNASALVAAVAALPAASVHDHVADGCRRALPPRLKAGEAIDGLRVEALLHASRLTLLYRVRREADGALLVLKTLLPEFDGDDEVCRTLVHEEWLARRAPGQGFPQVVDHAARAHLYYLMSWHAGETLQAALARGHRYRVAEVVDLGRALLRHLGALHRLGIVHRDLKPDNLHVDRDGRLRLLDLGVAAAAGEVRCESSPPGTPSYMAPELFAGQPADEVSDLYACGVTLYELLTRRYPYGEIEPFQHPQFGTPLPPTRYRPDTPAWLEAVLLKACARAPGARFETAEEFRLALERGAQRPLATPRRTPLVARNPGLALKLLVVASLLLDIILLYLLSRA